MAVLQGIQSINRYLGARLRQHRVVAGLTINELATRIGVSPAQLHRLETGLVPHTAGSALTIAQELDLSIEQMLGYTGDGFEAADPSKTEQSASI